MASALSPAPRASVSSSNNVSYEMFAPRSAAQVSRLSRIAALTAGPIATASTASSRNEDKDTTTLLKAMSPPLSSTADRTSPEIVGTGNGDGVASVVDDSVMATVLKAMGTSDHLTHLLKHSASLRLALRASINIAEDISNRHAELIRHSGELSAAADRLQEEQTVLSAHAEEIGMPLKHYDAVDSIGVLVGVLFKGKSVVRGLAKVKVDTEDFPVALDKIDDAVDFFGRESGGKEALKAELKRQSSSGNKDSQVSGSIEYFRRSLALQEAALYLIREAVVDRISATTSQITNALNIPKVPIAANKLEASLIYTRFHGISSRSNRLLSLVRKRLHRGEAYHELLQLCRNTYCTSRESLLKATISTHMEKLRDQHGLVGMTRLASVFLIRLCTVETALYLDFLGDRKEDSAESKADAAAGTTLASQVVSDDGTYYDSEFQSYLSTLCSTLHRTVRRGLVTVLDLDTLCQIVSVLREERTMASSSPTTTAAARAIASVIEDAQERLIFCATNTLTKEVTRFKATPADLDYPDKLRKKEAESSTPEEDAVQLQLQVYESWFPPMRSVLRILSKIFRVVEPRVFEDIALQAVQACTGSLKDGAKYILKRKGIMHADLFLVKHLLILREQLSPFDIDLRSVERQLDFSDAGKAVSRFLANRNRRLFSMTTENALVTLLREGVSVQEESVDSKRDLEDALRRACNDFIEHTSKAIAGGVVEFVEKCANFSQRDKLNYQPHMKAEKVQAMLVQVSERLEVQAGEVSTQMGLYLDDPATQSILLKPISRKVTKALEECRKYISQTVDGANGWDETNRGQMFMLVDEIDKLVKRSTKVSR